jgi:hypothetical protein
MKKIFTLVALLTTIFSAQAQNPFFEVVNYRGAFAPAPTTPWTDGWTNFNPQSTIYPAVTDSVSANITSNTTWTTGKTYLLRGLIYVKNGATLTIQPGVVIKGDATVSGGTALIITKGSKINAVGTSAAPIVFTSSKDTGARQVGDWGGVIILGKASLNRPGGVANIEGIATSTDTEFGGGTTPDDNDNSGNFKYARIEYGGYVFATDQEINGLTMGAVGRNTVIDYVQTSFTNDDAFEWFGGTVNCSHLVSFRNLDDDFDTDFGYTGSVQFALGVRDPNISDQSAGSTSEGFESDNDAVGSNNTPITSAVFSNVTWVGPYRGTVATAAPSGTFKFRRALRIRRATRLKVLNSVFTDAPYGVFMDGTAVRNNLQTGNTVFKNNIIAGCFRAAEPGTSSALLDSIFNNARWNNDSLTSTTGLLVSPYDYFAGDYRPASGSPALADVNFTDAAFDGRKIITSAASYIREVTYRGAFAPAPASMWTEGWCEWNPQSKIYPAATDTISSNITTNTTWTADKTYLLNGVIYVTNGATLTIQPGTVVRGNAAVSGGTALVITKNAKINAAGTPEAPIVFTSSKDTGTRQVGDWGGVIILGRAALNRPGGVANIEGIATSTNTEFGGGASPNDDDNSGVLRYARIEYGGYVFATDQEINGLTMGAVGRGTQIDHIQTSFVNDDAFEWFGGTVNCSYLVAYRCLDDNWDTDFGYSGTVQFALGVRDPNISDQSAGSTSEGFESDNDAVGSTNTPVTKCLFSNVTEIGPYRGTTGTVAPSGTFKFRRAVRIRRRSQKKLFNSVMMDYPYGVFIDGSNNRSILQAGTGKFKNNLIAGCFRAVEPGTASSLTDSIFNSTIWRNDSAATTTGILVSPYNYFAPDYRPASGSLATLNAAFTDSAFNGLVVPCDEVNAPGLMSGPNNITGCTNPQTYSIPAISNASSYFWTVPAGVTIVSGQGTRSITVNFLSTLAATWTGTISVVGRNDCGNTSPAVTKSLTKVAVVAPTAVTIAPIQTNVCGARRYRYSMPVANTALGYEWSFVGSLASSMTIDSGSLTSRVITVTFTSNAAATTDSVRARYTSSCFNTAWKAAKLSNTALNPPAAPTAITITAVQTNVCGARIYRYSAPALPVASATGPAATGYQWSFVGTLGETAVLDSGSLTGRTIRVSYTSNAAASNSDSVRVLYTSDCGNSLRARAKLSNTALNPPAAPTAITITAIQPSVCGNKIYRYSAPALPIASATAPAANGYTWSFEGSLGANAVLDSGSLNGRTIRVTYTSNAAGVAGDSLRVLYTTAGCGDSRSKAARLTNVVTALPSAPTAVTITPLQTNVCGARRYRYSAPALPNATASVAAATGYEWDFVGSMIEFGDIDSGSLNGRAFTVTYTSNDAATTADSVGVRYTSSCGLSARRAVRLSNTRLNPPAAPAAVTITPIQTNVCGARRYRYSTAALPLASATNAAATGYDWSFVGSLQSSMTIDSGSLSSRTFTVTFTSNAAAGLDSVRVAFSSACGNGPRKTAKLSNTALNPPAAPTAITQTLVSNVCGARKYRYSVPSLPLASATAGAADGYLWSMPTGTVGSTGTIDSGTLNSQRIVIVYTSNALATTDSIRFRYTSGCGNSAIRAAKLSNLALVCPGARENVNKQSLPVAATTLSATIFPNPNNGSFTLKATSGEMNAANATVQVYDMTGKLIAQNIVSNVRGNILANLQYSSLKSGMYTVKLIVGKSTTAVRMIVQ